MNTNYTKIPSRQEAETILDYAAQQNPGGWVNHSKHVAYVAETIALHANLDAERAYVCGLLHDIGRYEGVRALHHVIAGYNFMMSKGYDDVATICLTHSFPVPDLNMFGGGDLDCSDAEIEFIKNYLSSQPYDIYDNLIQLSDAMGAAYGVSTIDSRLMDVTRRHGFNEFTIEKWNSFYSLKDKFDNLCNQNIYTFFSADIIKSILLA